MLNLAQRSFVPIFTPCVMEDPPGIFKCALRCKTVTVQWLHDPMEIPKEKSESRKEHSVRSYPYPFFLAMLEAAILLWYNEAVQHLNMGGWYMAAKYTFRDPVLCFGTAEGV